MLGVCRHLHNVTIKILCLDILDGMVSQQRWATIKRRLKLLKVYQLIIGLGIEVQKFSRLPKL